MSAPLQLPGARVWLVDLTAEPSPAQCAWLDDEERAKAARFVFDADARRYRAAHVALRAHLGALLDVTPAKLCFALSAEGKPGLLGHELAFNLSHCGDAAAIAVGETAAGIGVDIERLRSVDDLDALAQRCFTAAEQRELAACGSARDELFLQGWTRKEACLKAVGCGLSLEPAHVEAGLAARPAEVLLEWDDRLHRLQLCSFRQGNLIGAVALRRRPATGG
ncbi:MAG: 4'-phosphopantetheinyl transferase superfamily protein [Piscinibacter sp.]